MRFQNKAACGAAAVALIASLMTSALTVPAMAANESSPNCTCQTSLPDNAESVGVVVFANGQVLASTSKDNGLKPASAGTSLVLGSQVVTGPNSSANLSIGPSCVIPMAANSEVIISGMDSGVCVRVSQAETSTPPSPKFTTANVAPLIVVGGGVGLALALGGGDNGASN